MHQWRYAVATRASQARLGEVQVHPDDGGDVDFAAVVDHMRVMQTEAQERQDSTVTAESNPEDEHVEEVTSDDGSTR